MKYELVRIEDCYDVEWDLADMNDSHMACSFERLVKDIDKTTGS